MSHYAVAVFSDDGDFDKLLAPYGETNEAYFVKTHYDAADVRKQFEKFRVENPNWTFKMYLENFGYTRDGDGLATYSNPNAKWDYYSLDGKSYLFDLRDDVSPDECDDGYYRKHDYDWYPVDEECEDDAREFWRTYIVPDDPKIQPPTIFTKEYYRVRFRTEDQYVKEVSRTVPYAFVTPDGVWHAPGTMGWFALSDDTADSWNRYVDEWDSWLLSEANPYVSLVDCHI